MSEVNIPIQDRYVLSIEEATVYFRIGEARLRTLIAENPDANFLIRIGNRTQIKRKAFESYIDKCSII